MPGASSVGKAGELAVRSEFLLHGYNVAVPDGDVGEDVFVVDDGTGAVWRVQVKTTMGHATRYGYRGRFFLPWKQVSRRHRPPLVFVLALRKKVGAWEFVVIRQEVLKCQHQLREIGNRHEDQLVLNLAYRESDIFCSKQSLQRFRNQFHLGVP